MGSLAKERISELESMTMETFKIKKQREKRLKKPHKTKYRRIVEQFKKCNRTSSRRKRDRNRSSIWNNNDWEFSKINVRQ